jgi:hypothetical protein
VKTTDIFDAMNTPDAQNGDKTRGFVLVTAASVQQRPSPSFSPGPHRAKDIFIATRRWRACRSHKTYKRIGWTGSTPAVVFLLKN